MRRIVVHFNEDITVQEITEMARAAGFFVRFTNGMTVVDRVPGIVRKDLPPNVSTITRKAK